MIKVFVSPMALLSIFAAATWCCPSARANLVIDPVFDTTITSDPNAATIEGTIDTAISNIEGDIANPVTVTIDFGEMNSGLGASSTYEYYLQYSDYLSYFSSFSRWIT